LRENVVKIKASLQPGSAPQIGFGFVVGKQDDQAVIVTANHVVRDEDNPDAVAKTPLITFYQNQGVEVPGVLQLATSAPTSRGDVAVILVPWPNRLTIANQASIVDPVAKDDSVWLIGKGGAWEESGRPGRIVSQDPVDRHLEFEGLNVAVGSSGGPLISKDGIIGMIVADDPSERLAKATSIEVIQKLVRDEWHYDWSLAHVNLTSISARFSHANGYFVQNGDKWIEYPPYLPKFGKGNFTFIPDGVIDGYLYLVDPTRHPEGDPNRPFTLRIPVQGGMAQWSYPNPWQWSDLYVVHPDR
jgi:hypothetical protein